MKSIRYNLLNQPDTVQFRNGSAIVNYYTADGKRTGSKYLTPQTTVVIPAGQTFGSTSGTAAMSSHVTARRGSLEYAGADFESDTLIRIHNGDGYLDCSEQDFRYFVRDYQGNIRTVYGSAVAKLTPVEPPFSLTNRGAIGGDKPPIRPTPIEHTVTYQRMQYYPFGLPYEAHYQPEEQPYKYGGKEFIELHGYDSYDFDARMYYPALCRFMTMDPLCEKYYSISPYAYCNNNPVKYIDPDGREIEIHYQENGKGKVFIFTGENADRAPKNTFVQNVITAYNYNKKNGGGENLQKALGGSMNFNADAFANAFQFNMTEDDLTELMMSMSGTQSASYDNNLQQLGYADFSHPSSISIYPKDFDNKEKVVEVLDHYNQQMEDEGKEEQVISYTDIVGTMMSSVTTIINTISYVLIAFVAISLIVSSIMIGVITYISVLERKKEIGILRAIGASKGNISQVFNAETFIIGLCAGLIGIGLTLLILIPGNMLIHALADNNRVSAILPIAPAIVLILLSVVLTLLGGLIPSRKAAKSDPVTALRTE